MEKTQVVSRKGWIFLWLWGILIIAGIVTKRAYGQPDLMVFFHLPAAVFLVLGGYEVSAPVRRRYKAALARNAR